MGYKKLTIEDFYKIDRLLSEAEEIMRNTKVEDESYLINHLRQYIRLKRTVGVE